jgi:hypothetical protein
MSSPFQKSFSAKNPMSPLNGAYTSAADGMVTVSYDDIHKDFQQGIANNVSKAYTKNSNPCDDPNTVQYTKDSVLKKCPKKTAPSTTNSTFGAMPADLKALADKETSTTSNKVSNKGMFGVQ